MREDSTEIPFRHDITTVDHKSKPLIETELAIDIEPNWNPLDIRHGQYFGWDVRLTAELQDIDSAGNKCGVY